MNEMGFRPNQNRTTSYSPLIVFSLFNVLKEREKKIESHIDIFIPFFAHILLEKYSNQTTIAKNQYSGEIQQFIKKEYSLQFPIHVVTEVFKRIRRYNLIQFKENEIIINHEQCKVEYNKIEDIENISQNIENFIEEFQKFYQNEKQENIEYKKIEQIIYSFLEKNNYDLLIANKKGYENLITKIDNQKIRNQDKYLFAKYLLKLYNQNENNKLEILLKINLGNIITNLVLVEDRNKYQANLSNLCIYIDAPILLRLLGLDGQEFQKASEEFLTLLKNQDVDIRIFNHSYQEAKELILSAKQWIDNSEYNPRKSSKCTRFIIENNKTEADIDLYIQKLENFIKEYQINIDNNQYYNQNDSEYQIDESILQELIEKNYQNHNISWRLKNTIAKDVKSIAYIYRLRENKKYNSLKEAKYIFVTSNSGLARASRIYENKNDNGKYNIPACLISSFLCFVVWQQNGINETIKEFSKLDFISYCYTYLQPNNELINKVIEEAEKQKKEGNITEENLQAIKTNHLFFNQLSQTTNNDSENYNNETFQTVNEKFKSQLQKENNKTLEQEKKKTEEMQHKYLVEKYKNDNYIISKKKKIKLKYIFGGCFKVTTIFIWKKIKPHILQIDFKFFKAGYNFPKQSITFKQQKISYFKKKLSNKIISFPKWKKQNDNHL